MTAMTAGAMTAVVTGAGSGIGRAVALMLVDAGYDVVAVGRRVAPLTALAEERPGRVRVVALDVRDADAVADGLGGVVADVVVVNHGICHTAAHDELGALAVWRETLATNLDGAFHVLHVLTPSMRDGGRVVAVASGLGKRGRAGKSAYAASKHGLLGLVRCLALELAPRGITVNAVCPGWVETEMAAADLARGGVGARAVAVGGIPLGRFVEAGEVASLVGWLCSGGGAMVTGAAYDLSGGEF